MIKKIFFYIIIIFSIFIFVILIRDFILYKITKNVISSTASSYQYNVIFDNKYYKLQTIKKMIINYYKKNLENLHNLKIKETKQSIENLMDILNIISNKSINYKSFLFDYVRIKDKNLEILDQNNIVIASSNILNLGKKEKLICDPLKNFGECEKIKNNFYYFIKYHPFFKIYLIEKISLIPSQKDIKNIKNEIIKILKSIPKIIIYYNKHLIKGKISSENFYIFSEIFPDIFIGEAINYKQIEELSYKINKEIFNAVIPIIKNSIYGYILLIILSYGLLFFIFRKKILLIESIFNKYFESSIKDKLLDIYNRDGFKLNINNYKTLLIIDFDNFKYINDTFGHNRGDEILKKFISILKDYFKNDLIGRWGGDEFLIATNKNKLTIKNIFKEINKKIKNLQDQIDNKKEKILSVSVGGCSENIEFEKKFEKADLALYKVKRTTKGKTLFYSEIDYIKINKEES